MFCALLGKDIRLAFAGPLVLWFLNSEIQRFAVVALKIEQSGFTRVIPPNLAD